MGRIRAIGHRRALVGVIAVAVLALAACMPTNPPRPPVPTAAFSVSTAPLVASFTDQSTGVINTRSWDFGDGETSTEQSPTHTSAAHGDYTVTLTVNGPGGSDTASQQITVNAPNAAPSVMISSPESGASFPLASTVTFTGTADDTEDGNISGSIEWSSSINGALSTGASISKGNLSVGTHTITASVTDTGGDTASASITVTINLAPASTTTTTTNPPGGDPGDCGGRRCVPGDPGDDPPDDGPPDRR
jgi:PKD repeat protein